MHNQNMNTLLQLENDEIELKIAINVDILESANESVCLETASGLSNRK